MKRTLILFIFLFLSISCTNELEFENYSDFKVSGEKIQIYDPQTRLDVSRGDFSPIIELQINKESSVIYPDNRPTIFLFVAHWCPYCREEIPEVIEWINQADLINTEPKKNNRRYLMNI